MAAPQPDFSEFSDFVNDALTDVSKPFRQEGSKQELQTFSHLERAQFSAPFKRRRRRECHLLNFFANAIFINFVVIFSFFKSHSNDPDFFSPRESNYQI